MKAEALQVRGFIEKIVPFYYTERDHVLKEITCEIIKSNLNFAEKVDAFIYSLALIVEAKNVQQVADCPLTHREALLVQIDPEFAEIAKEQFANSDDEVVVIATISTLNDYFVDKQFIGVYNLLNAITLDIRYATRLIPKFEKCVQSFLDDAEQVVRSVDRTTSSHEDMATKLAAIIHNREHAYIAKILLALIMRLQINFTSLIIDEILKTAKQGSGFMIGDDSGIHLFTYNGTAKASDLEKMMQPGNPLSNLTQDPFAQFLNKKLNEKKATRPD